MEPDAPDAARWRHRHALFDNYADLVARGVCTLPEAVDSYLWEIGAPKAERMALLAGMTICHTCGGALGIRGACEDACGTACDVGPAATHAVWVFGRFLCVQRQQLLGST